MEINYSLKLLESTVRPIAPETYKYIRGVLTARAGYEDKPSVLAITRLCEILSETSENLVKTRRRTINSRMADALKSLYNWSRISKDKYIHRFCFMGGVGNNDFSILRHWGLIEAGPKKGTWAITELGKEFCEGVVPIHESVIQLGGTKGNYRIDYESKKVYIGEV